MIVRLLYRQFIRIIIFAYNATLRYFIKEIQFFFFDKNCIENLQLRKSWEIVSKQRGRRR